MPIIKRAVKRLLHKTGYDVQKRVSRASPTLLCQRGALQRETVKTIVDIGANVGDTVHSYRQNWPQAELYAFEPHPDLCAKLKDRFQNDDKVKVRCEAVGEQRGTARLQISSSSTMHSIVGRVEANNPYVSPGLRYGDSIEVPVTTVDDLVSRERIQNIDILKIDVEGYEKYVLQGAREILRDRGVRLICIEVMFVELFEEQWKFHDIARYMEEFEYSLFDTPFLKRAENGQLRWGDAVYLSPHVNVSVAQQRAQ